MTGTKVTVPEISLNVQNVSSVRLQFKVSCTLVDVLDKLYSMATMVTLDSPDVEDEILFHIFF
jgi:hypothetical protein